MSEQRPARPRRFEPREKPEWFPRTALGILVKNDRVTPEQIFKHCIPIKETEIVDHLFPDLQEKVLLVKSVQKQTKAGQRTRIKVVVAIGNNNGFVGIGSKAAKEMQTAIRGATTMAKLNLRPVKLGYWGDTYGETHTVPVKTSAKVGSVNLQIIPAPKGSGIVAAPNIKPIFQLAGIKDLFTWSVGNTSTTENFIQAAFKALTIASEFYTPGDWAEREVELSPMCENTDLISKFEKKMILNNN